MKTATASKLDLKTAAESAAGRAARIRVLISRREDADGEIAAELKAAKHGEFKGRREAYLTWVAEEFGWAPDTVRDRESPKRMRAGRKNAARRARKGGTSTPPPQKSLPRVSFTDGTAARRAIVVEMIQAGFKALSKVRHPDVGGSTEAMAELSDARDWAVDYITNPPLLNL